MFERRNCLATAPEKLWPAVLCSTGACVGASSILLAKCLVARAPQQWVACIATGVGRTALIMLPAPPERGELAAPIAVRCSTGTCVGSESIESVKRLLTGAP